MKTRTREQLEARKGRIQDKIDRLVRENIYPERVIIKQALITNIQTRIDAL